MIFHIAAQDDWEAALELGSYDGPTLRTEGFVHASRESQVVDVANRLFRGRDDLVLLLIDDAALTAEVRPENLEGGEELYPHVYGSIECAAVLRVLPFRPAPDGRFALPPELGDGDAEVAGEE